VFVFEKIRILSVDEDSYRDEVLGTVRSKSYVQNRKGATNKHQAKEFLTFA
jgi:hypothetical protein